MGGGASLMEGGMEELLTTTILIGRAISAVTFPGRETTKTKIDHLYYDLSIEICPMFE